ncbi:MAG TPA: sigma-70 family RNA polymerase sigma factor [Anaerolineae bacterium]|nr:sigma-70 family RNA polymerase sigma factor [Anaerolineae bacterium]
MTEEQRAAGAAIVDQVLRDRGWSLVEDPAEFAREVCLEAEAQAAATGQDLPFVIERRTVNRYCRLLYAACGERDSQRQRTAFLEIWNYLYPIALYRLHGTNGAQDCTQQALVKIWRKRDQCRDPGAFLRWCDQVLLNECRDYLNKRYIRIETDEGVKFVPQKVNLEDAPMSQEKANAEESSPAPGSESPLLENSIQEERLRALVVALRVCLQNEKHVTVLVELFIHEKGFKQVAELLETTPLNVQVMKSRALKKLRECESFLQMYEEWFQ